MENKHPVGHQHHKMLPVWFFVGVLLLVYGLIIFWVSIEDYSQPSSVVLSGLHAGVWGGILLIALGALYTIRFWPRRNHKPLRPKQS